MHCACYPLISCSHRGICIEDGCVCNASYTGDNCNIVSGIIISAGQVLRELSVVSALMMMVALSWWLL